VNPTIEELEDLLDAILAGVQEMLQSGQEIPPDFQAQIAEEINLLTSEIDALYAQGGANLPPTEEPGIAAPPISAEPSENVKLIWILAGGQEEAFVSYLSSFPDPEFRQLLSNPNALENIIMHLHVNNPIPTEPGQADGIPKSDLNSSNVFGVKYDFNKNKLLVRFNNGSVYSYDTPPQMYNLIAGGQASATTDDKRRPMRFWKGKNPSMGAAVWQYLRNTGVPYKRLK